jgi:SAM-dependent methyltransferase
LNGTEAEIYERYLVPAVFAPWATMLIEHAALQSGERVLDVACGTGVVARLAAKLVGSTGQIIGLDNNAERLGVARSLPPIPGISPAWQEGNALAMPFADASFDALGEAKKVRSLLAGGPFNEVQLHTVVLTVRFASPEQFVGIEMFPSLPDSVLMSEVKTALQPYVSHDGLAFPMQAHLVTAQK